MSVYHGYDYGQHNRSVNSCYENLLIFLNITQLPHFFLFVERVHYTYYTYYPINSEYTDNSVRVYIRYFGVHYVDSVRPSTQK